MLLAIAIGTTTWAALHPSRLGAFSSNQLTEHERIQALSYLGGAAGALLLIYVATALVGRLRSGAWEGFSAVARVNRALGFLLAGPFVAALSTPEFESDHPVLTLLFIGCAAACCLPTLLALPRRARPPDAPDAPEPVSSADGRAELGWRQRAVRIGRWLAVPALGALWAGYTAWFARLAVLQHRSLGTRAADLGCADNFLYRLVHGGPLGCSFAEVGTRGAAELQPILVLFAPVYLVYPRAELLLVLQAAWLGAGLVPVYLLAKRHLDSRAAGLVLALVYALGPALHGATLSGFTPLTLSATPLLWAFYFLETGATKRYYLAWAVTVLTSPHAALLMSVVGLCAGLGPRRELRRRGWTTLLLSLAYVIVVHRVLAGSGWLPASALAPWSLADELRALAPDGTGARGALTSLAINPAFALEQAASEAKLVLLAALLLPLLFLPLVARSGRYLLLYGMLFALLASEQAAFFARHHYAMLLLPALFALAPLGLRRLEGPKACQLLGVHAAKLRTALLGGMLVAAGLASWKLGAIAEGASVLGGKRPLAHALGEKERASYAALRTLLASVPPSASASATDRLAPHMSNRRTAYRYADRQVTDWYLVDERELSAALRRWHRKRIRTERLVEAQRADRFKLYRLDPKVAEPAAEDKADGGTRGKPPSRTPSRRANE